MKLTSDQIKKKEDRLKKLNDYEEITHYFDMWEVELFWGISNQDTIKNIELDRDVIKKELSLREEIPYEHQFIGDFAYIHETEKESLIAMLEGKFLDAQQCRDYRTRKQYIKHEIKRLEKYRPYFDKIPVLEQWFDFLRDYQEAPTQLAYRDIGNLKALENDGYSSENENSSINKILQCLSGKWMNTHPIMSAADFDILTKNCHFIFKTGELPKKIIPIKQSPAPSEFIRFTFYLVCEENKNTNRKCKALWVDFLKKSFLQFSNLDRSSIDKKFSVFTKVKGVDYREESRTSKELYTDTTSLCVTTTEKE